jgi:hypothetical protein
MRAIDIDAIRARRAMLTDQIGHHRREISIHHQEIGKHEQAIISLESKLTDLDVAERVFAEIEGETSDVVAAAVPQARPIDDDTASPESLEVATESEAANRGAQEKHSLVSDAETDREVARSDVSPKIPQAIAQAAELWLRPSNEISAAEIGRVVGLSTRTLYNRLGPREAARQSADDPDETDSMNTNNPSMAPHSTKPEGIPLMAEMILEALSLAISEGKPGLRVSELIAFVHDRYWAEAPATSVGPVAWKMSKTGELQNNNSVYSLPRGAESVNRERPSRNRKGIKRPRRKQSLGDRVVQECIRIIRDRKQPVSVRDLCAVLAQRGIHFRGKTPPDRRLAHCLSSSPELVGDHSRGNKTRGWSLKEWETAPDSPLAQAEVPQTNHVWETEAAE